MSDYDQHPESNLSWPGVYLSMRCHVPGTLSMADVAQFLERVDEVYWSSVSGAGTDPLNAHLRLVRLSFGSPLHWTGWVSEVPKYVEALGKLAVFVAGFIPNKGTEAQLSLEEQRARIQSKINDRDKIVEDLERLTRHSEDLRKGACAKVADDISVRKLALHDWESPVVPEVAQAKLRSELSKRLVIPEAVTLHHVAIAIDSTAEFQRVTQTLLPMTLALLGKQDIPAQAREQLSKSLVVLMSGVPSAEALNTLIGELARTMVKDECARLDALSAQISSELNKDHPQAFAV